MRVLVTNDDGVQSPGLHALARVAADAGLEVIIAAPHQERSGASASLSALESDGRFVIHEDDAPVPGVARVLGVEASPAFIVMAALAGAFGDPPALVLSGVNLGPNTGHAILHSGTVGAALTAATHACPGVAVSLAGHRPTQFETAGAVAADVLGWVLAREVAPDLVLNVNVPNVPLTDLRGLRHARLAEFGAVQAKVREIGEDSATITYEHVEAKYEADTDAALVREGWATITALVAPCQAPDVDPDTLPRGDRAERRDGAAAAAPVDAPA